MSNAAATAPATTTITTTTSTMEVDSEQPSISKIKSSADRDIIRLIGQHLVSLGLKQTVDQLLQESGIYKLEHPSASNFRYHILNGEWDKAETYLSELAFFMEGKENCINDMRLLLAEQKYLELLEEGNPVKAVQCLRLEITPFKHDIDQLKFLTSLAYLTSIDELRKRAKWDGKGLKSRQRLIKHFYQYIPPSLMLPPKRLNTLLNQALQLQKERCPLHNQLLENDLEHVDYLTDHVCLRDQFPCETIQILYEHNEEVLYCKFSNDGSMLAAGGKGGKIFIWEVDPETLHLSLKFGPLTCQSAGQSINQSGPVIACLVWSPDDNYLLACATEDCTEGPWVFNMQSGQDRGKFSSLVHGTMTTSSWSKDNQIATGSIRGLMYICDIDGNVLCMREGVRLQCLAYRKDGKTILGADTHNRIRAYKADQLDGEEIPILEEDYPIVSFSCDRDDRLCAISLMNQGIHLWDLNHRVLLRKFQGVVQGEFTTHSSFGGANQTFLASGSEDDKVYIYHIQRELPIAILSGHKSTVNCVSWNPKHHELLVSASDDGTIRVWAPSVNKC